MARIDLLLVLLSWASHLSHYPYPDKAPAYRLEPHSFFVEHACGGNKKCSIAAWYNNDGTIYLDKRLKDWEDPMVRSVIVHELVHYLQDLSGKFKNDNCEDQLMREREAYAVQRIYLNRIAGRFAAVYPVYSACPG
ncbi:MAG: hypothetical protein P8126_02245 [Gammaproteobacteria bacterium]|jgi:hypothetical protein